MRERIDAIYRQFTTEALNIKHLFLQEETTFGIPEVRTTTFKRAFFVLFHACLEDYFEQIVLALILIFKEKYENATFFEDLTTLSLSEVNEKTKRIVETYLMMVSFAQFKNKDVVKDFTEEFKRFEKLRNDRIRCTKPTNKTNFKLCRGIIKTGE